MRVIRGDVGLREILPLVRVPSSDAAGDWLRRMGEGQGLVVGDEFRDGNASPGSRNLEFIKYCIKQMPMGKRIKALRADAASYQADIINFCDKNAMQFAIGADLDEAVVRAIKSLPESEWQPYRGGHVAETVHCMNRTKKGSRLIVVRRPYQKGLFDERDMKLSYKSIASNKIDSADAVMDWYHQRGDCSENRIKELKIGFGMQRMPCGQTVANAVFFRKGAMAYNLYRLFVLRALDVSWHKHQVQTVRWRLYQTAGKVVDHANRVYLKVRHGLHGLFDKIRLRIWEFANT